MPAQARRAAVRLFAQNDHVTLFNLYLGECARSKKRPTLEWATPK